MEVSAAVYARMCGVSQAAICILKKNNSPKLVFNSAGKLDTDNPVNRMYLEQHQTKMKESLEVKAMESAVRSAGASAESDLPTTRPSGGAALAAASPGEKNAAKAPTIASDSAGEMLRMTVGQLVRKYGSIDGVEKYSKILTNLTIADERGQRIHERRMLQIPKDFVVQRVFAYVDQLMNQLLDVPEAVCDQVIAVSLAGGDGVRASVMHILSDNLTKCISGAKEHITNELSALKGKYDRQDDSMLAMMEQLETVREVG